MEERTREEQPGGGTGKCHCDAWPTDHLPGEDKPIRRLLKALEEELEGHADRPTEATRKFGDDLKELDKEYQGIAGVVSKYEDFYDKLECKLAEARSWRDEIAGWCDEKVKPETKAAIEALRDTDYESKEKDICCKWIDLRARLIRLYDCLGQAEKKEEESKDDYEAIKGFEKTLTDRFAELKSLYDKAKTHRDGERYKSVCAVGAEYADLYNNLSTARTWDYLRSKCEEKAYPRQGKDPKQEWPPDRFKTELTKALRALILARYQRFRWRNKSLELEIEGKKYREACDKFRKGRREEFIQEAEDIEA